MTGDGARLRRLATGLLVACAVLLVASTWAMRQLHPGFAWVQAFAEAALVGGLADWFAVTALFRRPLGLPIPHTAIIPRSKDRIGDALATFIRDNFLQPRVVIARLERLDAAGMAATWLRRPAAEGRVRRNAVDLLRPLASGPAADVVARAVRDRAGAALRGMKVAPLAGQMLAALLAAGRHRPLFDSGVAWAARVLDDQESMVRAMIGERTNWILRLAGLDERVADAIVAGLRRLLNEIATDEHHPVREAADRALGNLAFDLQHLAETRAKAERLWSELLDNPAVASWIDGLLGQAREGLAGLIGGDAPARLSIAIAESLENDPALAAAVNALARRGVAGAVARHGDQIVALVSDTIRSWDATTVTDKLENAVGRDLQYIRLNGTLIGGLIGVALHAALALV